MVNDTKGPFLLFVMANSTSFDSTLPPLPSYTLEPRGDFFSWISDVWLSLILPIFVYWVMSLIFHVIDVLDLFPQYRLHTPEEILRRNHASRYEVARDVVIQQIIQVATGTILALSEPPEVVGKADYDVAVWATRLRLAQRALPGFLSLLGVNATAISKSMSATHPLLAGALAGGYYPSLSTAESAAPAFAPWELAVARVLYHIVVPGIQFFVAVSFLDSWQYFLHRLMHVNRWMYTTFHSRHHRLYVPYAYGALYNHPLEGFLLDTLGAAIAFKLTGMTVRQGTCFFAFSTIKTVDDHCGYSFPWDPLQLITSNNAAYHDIHHQTWGIKNNFSQPFFTFWDGMLGTKYKGPRADRLADRKRADKTK
ncbi:Fatty acid hydroxylase [Metarhizium album ARSEF 1941]|uniref:Fatty acid hydroxylase n=1 Tax=Metarhizium album (strain ARSEF 1941) TaxID=1081103 RepID=A0A0B2WNM4_METAS|nr:Fatty acid hydroxylase [Metarhizium album ARSEF 1941]KHN97656.1 Fatty acid hydroxylase [Metarhizium album ARSEF 1941]